jgi:hypothetical protein
VIKKSFITLTPKDAEKAAVRKRIDECKKKILQDAEFKLIEVSQNGDTSAEYSTIADKVIKYIQPGPSVINLFLFVIYEFS